MTKLLHATLAGIVAVVVLAAATPALTKLASALVAPLLIVGIIAALLRCVWWLTGPR
ncbi:MAG: hypothetical protein ACYDHN_16500 [Solirubrobacteraceae bacterium]